VSIADEWGDLHAFFAFDYCAVVLHPTAATAAAAAADAAAEEAV
jgi:hypothetical protein